MKKEKDLDENSKVDIDDLYEYDKKVGIGSWKDDFNKLINKIPNIGPAAASYSMATRRHILGEVVDVWIDNYLLYGDFLSRRNVDIDGNIIHN